MPSPPEITKPFANPMERDTARAAFLQLGGLLEDVMTAASGGPITIWLNAELSKPLRGLREPPQDRLNRYRIVFAEELQAAADALEAERQNRLDDSALRAANYLAQRLLASLLDCGLDEVATRAATV
ncbi:MAG: hypothetical protein ACYDAQ_10540 [Mycobacteriales bacterium]